MADMDEHGRMGRMGRIQTAAGSFRGFSRSVLAALAPGLHLPL